MMSVSVIQIGVKNDFLIIPKKRKRKFLPYVLEPELSLIFIPTIQDLLEPKRSIGNHKGTYRTKRDPRRPYWNPEHLRIQYRTLEDHKRLKGKYMT